MALGALLIKQIEGLPDEKLVLHIQENAYMQYFCGMQEFSHDIPFVPSLMVEFRKRFSDDVIREINEKLFKPAPAPKNNDDDETPPPPNNGTMILDLTCTPANIQYPQDLGLCNEAREKTEAMVETMHKNSRGAEPKPRLDKKQARKAYLKVAKKKKRTKSEIRKAIRKQLSYIRRNLRSIDRQLENGMGNLLSNKQRKDLDTIRRLYEQQAEMLAERKHTVENRIVSISQPHVRPIVRGKPSAQTEFGAVVAIHVIEGSAFVDNISWEAYHEANDFVGSVSRFKEHYGFYPEAVIVDKKYRTRDNIKFCKTHGIRISGPRLGRPKVGDDRNKQQEYEDGRIRNTVEGKFGIGKKTYGLGRVMANLAITANTVINLAFLAMNLVRKLLFPFFYARYFVVALEAF
jgi:hypothetical protein